VPPIIIFSGAYYLCRYFDNDIDGDTLFARSDSGYSNNKLGLKYLEHFNRYTKNLTKGRYRMLIFDGHSSHLSQNFLDYC
jgi:esterase/lipase superfamily enzyme